MAHDPDIATFDLTRSEARVVIAALADEVTAALADFELDESHENAGAAENVRERIVDAFGDETR